MDSLESDLISREGLVPGTPLGRFDGYFAIASSPVLGDAFVGL